MRVFALSTLLMLLPLVAVAQVPPMPGPTINVSGSGQVRVAPDLLSLDIAVDTQGKNAITAGEHNAKLTQQVMTAVRDRLGSHGTVQSGSYDLFPVTDNPPSGPSHIVGYRAVNSLRVRTADLALAGALIDTALAAGANQINSLSFGLHDDSAARAQAIARAVIAAQTQARALAAALGVKLGPILRASTAGESIPESTPRFAMAMAVPQTPVAPGQLTVSANVALVYRIAGAKP
ncbi:MAG TPA: SIMPL domain-containing protein [Candidatus Binataceae bacterium]|nr:SIMPL domain-containing protein [Candidatus Binataceae bacterium]